ncbi:cytochrome P450 2J4-like [Lytechinus pictus]|uniref:cytochrome P450 2J4-like n=1 Tax=Lytechinus pictus TaxID=7653 RepID=UPI0030BA013A
MDNWGESMNISKMSHVMSADFLTHHLSAVLTAGLTAILLVLFGLTRIKDVSSKKLVRPPGPSGIPLLGNLLTVAFSKLYQHELVNQWSKKYGDVFWFKIFGTGVVIINDMDVVQKTFQNSEVCDRAPFFALDHVIGRENNGIAFANGGSWKEQRKFFVSVFRKVDIGVSRLEDIVSDQVRNIVTQVKNLKGEKFDPAIMVNMSIANIITRIITGVTYKWEDKKFQHIVACSGKLFDISGPAGLFSLNPVFARLPLPVNYEIRRLSLSIVDFIQESIDEHRKHFKSYPDAKAKDYIGAYLKEMAGADANTLKSFDDSNLVVSCFDALLAGWETVASTLRWTIYLLSTHPEAQERMRQEILDLVGSERFPTIADRQHLPLTEATIAECMRFIPAVPIHLPHVTSQDCKIGGFDVPKGSAVAANLHHFAKSPTLWEDPDVFRPERFIDDEGKFKRGMEPIPFGYGKRQCPGEQLARMEMFIFTTFLVQNFDLRLPAGAKADLQGVLGLTWRPNHYFIEGRPINSNEE